MRNTLRIPIKGYIEAPTSLGDKIRNRRIELQLTLDQLAALLNVTKEAIVYWEYNRGKPKVHNYPKIIEVLGLYPFNIDTSMLGGKIIAYRYSKGLSRKKFSKLLGVDESTLRTWEENKYIPVVDFMQTLKNLFKDSDITYS
ncbi:helix-turn-helix transcriptional regulator [Emticicia sp. C21]|uniref:helix-turn-helix domain-containing protein n=1 Tax=Emticicia sp. C21 TaxID=2302915 RepID=UPI001314D549|nr:helix-turn-helix transcriptional regulator [Emticicia sp. C21]